MCFGHLQADTEDRLLFIDEVEVLTEKKRESGITCSTEEEELGFEELGVIEVDDGDDLIDDARLKPMEVRIALGLEECITLITLSHQSSDVCLLGCGLGRSC